MLTGLRLGRTYRGSVVTLELEIAILLLPYHLKADQLHDMRDDRIIGTVAVS